MATSRSLHRTLRSFSTTTSPSYHSTHQFSEPKSLVANWNAPSNPKEAEAEAKLSQLRKYYNLLVLRRDYAKHVKEVRMKSIMEVELMRLEMLRVDEARKEALRIQNEQTKRLKAEAAKVRAQKRQAAKQESEQTLLKQKAEKLENLKKKEMLREAKKKEKNEVLHCQSSPGKEPELEKKT
ncbi:hypothetical protein M0R45_020374 [Rubus argutus]|uniref:Uncharacterized protein n=1 Tax=Rubus argutus TaxID=59490 RepID=A0AAW1X9J3_RUBAR